MSPAPLIDRDELARGTFIHTHTCLGFATAVCDALTAPRFMFALAALQHAAREAREETGVAKFTKVKIPVAVGNRGESASLQLKLPNQRRDVAIATPAQLHKQVAHAWGVVVAPNQAGLTDAKAPAPSTELSAGEAWHHYQAAQQGVVDSARFLVAFSIVPSLQSNGAPLHAAAARGDLEALRRLIDEVPDVDAAAAADGTTALHAAAAAGHAAAVALLLEAGAHSEAVGLSGATPLMMAAAMGHEGAAAALLAGGADPSTAHRFGASTALHFAAEMGRAALISTLCAAGASAAARKTTGGTPLHTAADCDQSEAIGALLAPPCAADAHALLNGDTTPLYLAAQRGFVNASRALLDGGASIDFTMPTGRFSTAVVAPGGGMSPPGAFYPEKNTERGNGATALHVAVENGHHAVVELLLARGARQTNSMEGATPLVLAVQYHHPEIALTLARARPTPALDARVPIDGSSALFAAAGAGYDSVVTELLALGAAVDIANNHGATPLSHALVRGHASTAKLLLAAGANPALGPGGGGGALHALLGGSLSGPKLAKMVRTMLAAGHDADSRRTTGRTPLDLAAARGEAAAAEALIDAGAALSGGASAPPLSRAAQRGHLKMVRLLLRRGADSSAAEPSMHGATALYLAAQGGFEAVAAALLDAGADVDAALEKIGLTPLFIASAQGYLPVVRLLLGRGAAVGSRNWNGLSPLHMAALRGTTAIAQLLRDHGAAVDDGDGGGATPLLSLAAGEPQGEGDAPLADAERKRALRWLLAAGASTEARRAADGYTPVLAAAAGGRADLIAELLRAGADAGAVADDGRTTPLRAAVAGGHLAAAEALAERRGRCGGGARAGARREVGGDDRAADRAYVEATI